MGTQIKFLRGNSTGLATLVANQTVQDGYFYLTTDTKRLYAGISRTTGTGVDLALLNHDVTFVDSMSVLADINPKEIDGAQLYYAKQENVLAIWDTNAKAFVKINEDKGATSVEIDASSTGNAVTSATYDPATRKIILKKDETFVTALEFNAAKPSVYQISTTLADITSKTVEEIIAMQETAIVGKAGDVLILTYPASQDDIITTAYTYNNKTSKWVACTGNVNAENVYFTSDLLTTSAVGNITLTNGQATIAATGKNLKEVFSTIFVKEKTSGLVKTNPSASISTSKQYVEVGSTVTPSYDASFNAGEYLYGPATGITVDSWKVTNNKTDEELTSKNGSFTSYTFDGTATSYTITAAATHTEGAVPVSNVGNPVSSAKIAGNTVSASKTLFESYVPNFYGYTTSVNKLSVIDATTVTSAFIRSLTNQKETTTPLSEVAISEKWYQFFYAVPAGRSAIVSAKDANNITFTVKKLSDITINNAGSVTSKYDIYYISNAAEYGATTVNMSWS